MCMEKLNLKIESIRIDYNYEIINYLLFGYNNFKYLFMHLKTRFCLGITETYYIA